MTIQMVAAHHRHSLKISGLLLILSDILFAGFMFFHPTNNAQGALSPLWTPVHLAWFCAYLLIICSFLPLYVPIINLQNSFLSISYWLSFIGTVLSLPIAVWDSFIIPYLARHAPDFILQIEEISMETPVLIFRIIVFLTIFVFSAGFMMYGIAIAQTGIASVYVGLCLIVGAPLFWIGALFVSTTSLGNIATEIGAFLFGLGLINFGWSLIKICSQDTGLSFAEPETISNKGSAI
jgi:hypothetical protein